MTVQERISHLNDVYAPTIALTEDEELVVKALRGADDVENGRYRDAVEVFADLKARYAA